MNLDTLTPIDPKLDPKLDPKTLSYNELFALYKKTQAQLDEVMSLTEYQWLLKVSCRLVSAGCTKEGIVDSLDEVISQRDHLEEKCARLETQYEALVSALKPFVSLNPKSPRVQAKWDEFVQNAKNALNELPEPPSELERARETALSLEFQLNQERNLNRDHEKDYLAVWKLIKQPNESVVEAAQRLLKELKSAQTQAELSSATLTQIFQALSLPPGDMGAFENYCAEIQELKKKP